MYALSGFLIGCALWLGFCIWFAQALKISSTFAFEGDAVQSAVWYYISCSPAVLGVCFELLQNRVELYEPIVGGKGEENSVSCKDRNVNTSIAASSPVFKSVKVSSVLAL